VQQLAQEGLVDVVEKESHAYRKDDGSGVVLILKKTSGAPCER
jgi:hypothetical protein